MNARDLDPNPDAPRYVHPEGNRIPRTDIPAKMKPIPQSRMFTLKAAAADYRERAGADAPIYDASQGDGGISLPGVRREILERACALQIDHGTAYTPPAGTDRFRAATAETYWKLEPDTGWGPQNIAFAQGGRDALCKAYDAIMTLGTGHTGDLVVVSRVPWISYNWGPYGVGLNVLRAPGRAEDGWRYTPEAIRACAGFAARDGRRVAALVITSPDNPTGRSLPLDDQIALARVALEEGYRFVIFDWIYHWITDSGPSDINTVLRAFPSEERERLVFLDGLTKSLGASNIRSAHLVAGSPLVAHIQSRASHGVIPSFHAQAVAIAAYEMGFGEAAAPIIGPTNESRQALRQILTDAGMRFIMGDGYYAFIDVDRWVEGAGVTDSVELGAILAREHGVLLVPGGFFSDSGARWIRFSYALTPEQTRAAADQFLGALASFER